MNWALFVGAAVVGAAVGWVLGTLLDRIFFADVGAR